MIDLDALEALAKAATPGPWRRGYSSGRCVVDHNNGRGGGHDRGQCDHRYVGWIDDEHHISRDPGYEAVGAPYILRQDVCGNFDYEEGGVIEPKDAVFIAAADPSTVLALIARLRAAELVCLAVLGVVDVTTGAVEPDWAGNENWQDVKTALRAYLASKASR